MWYFTLLLFVVSSYYGQAYKAAVVHYYPKFGRTPEETFNKNVNEYRKYVSKAKSKGVDIIVFPEYGLVTTLALTSPEEYSMEIQNPAISQFGTIAKDNEIYLIVNLFVHIDDKDYNTNLVFDRNGTLILKYHKIHLYNEFGLTPGAPNQTATFSTDFGVTFGIFTCFDMLFANPSMRVLEGGNVTDVIFILGWLPSYIALSMQHGYSEANNLNLLAANYGKYLVGQSGTGIYLSDGRAAKVVNDSAKSQMVVREVPPKKTVEKTCHRSDSKHSLKIVTTSKYYFHDVDLSKKSSSTQICNANFCCIFDITLDEKQTNPTDTYKLMIFDDFVNYNNLEANIRICTLLACRGDKIDSCGAMTNVTTTFKRISVEGNFARDNSTFYRPITLHTSLLPLTPVTYCGTNSSSIHLRTKNQKGVIVFGLFERKDTVIDRTDDTDGARNSKIFLMLIWGRPYYFPIFRSAMFD